MKRSFLLVAVLFLCSLPSPATSLGCFAGSAPSREALVDAGLSSIRAPIEVRVGGDPSDPYCDATLVLPLSTIPSRSVVPRPRELAGQLAPVMKVLGVETCTIEVWFGDDLHPVDDREPDEDTCRSGEFRFHGGSWSAEGEDVACA